MKNKILKRDYIRQLEQGYLFEGMAHTLREMETQEEPMKKWAMNWGKRKAADVLAQAAWEEKARQKEKDRLSRLAAENPYMIQDRGDGPQERQVSMEVRQSGYGRNVIGRYAGPASLTFRSALHWAEYYARAYRVNTVAVDTADGGYFQAEFGPSGRVS
jgi:hypothetical protein